MSKALNKSKKINTKKAKLEFDFNYQPGKKNKIIFLILIASISLLFALYYLIEAVNVNKYSGFPLDDPWIHLTFARNLIRYHSFSYFKNELATAGSTSPIYTLILAIGFVVTNNEMILSYVVGILFLILSVISFYFLSSYEFAKENYYALMITCILIADKWLNFISVSGMETTMFVFILIASAFFYKKRNPVLLSIFLGLILWSRPDGMVFIAALAIDYFLAIQFSKNDNEIKLFSKKDLLKISVISGTIVILYFAMNLYLSGSLLPNTYNAKLAYYSPELRSRSSFLQYEVWEYFTNGAYGIIAIGFFFSVLKTIYELYRKKYNNNFLYIIFIIGLIFIYWYKLPYAHRFGRYLMPVIPFMILVSGLGFRDIFKFSGNYFKNRNFVVGGIIFIFSVIFFLSLKNYSDNKNNYAEQCEYIHDRHIVTAKWINENTKPDEIIATHDVGAIGYYCERKLIDVAGLITPELISKINDNNYATIMTEHLKKNGANYLLFQREWYRVVNQNPLFTSVNKDPVETIDVFKFYPDKTHILTREVNSMVMGVQNLIAQKAYNQALQYLNQIVKMDPQSSYTYYLIANTYAMLNDKNNFEKNLIKALDIFPDYKEVLFQLGNFYKQTNRNDEAKKYLERYLKISPDDKKVQDIYKSLFVADTTKIK